MRQVDRGRNTRQKQAKAKRRADRKKQGRNWRKS